MHSFSSFSQVMVAGAATGMLAAVAFCDLSIAAAEEMRFEVVEQAGIRRTSYPVRIQLKPKQPVDQETNFRLLAGKQDMVAQIRRDATNNWWLDFNISLLPYESKQMTLRYGADVPPGRERTRGHALTQRQDSFEVANAPYITWTISRDLSGLLRSVAFPPNDHLRSDSPGLHYVDRQGRLHRIGGDAWQVTPRVVSHGYEGVALRFEIAGDQPELPGVTSVVNLHFPVTKSWVEVDWQITDPEDSVAGLGAELNLNLAEPKSRAPTLFDFGAGSLVYKTLRAGERAELRAGGSGGEFVWRASHGSGKRLEPFVTGPRRTGTPALAEGWAHIMDQHSCLALAVHEFAQHGEDLIGVAAEGQVQIRRAFSGRTQPGPKRLRFWLHFVYFPPHRSAATSPQAMQNPLVVRWLDP